MPSIYDTAKDYLTRGYSVIPIAANQKTPTVKWVQDGYADKRPTFIDLQAWFAGRESNLAIVTGPVSGLLVVDIDKPELFTDYYNKYPTHLMARTPKGGYHLYYKYAGSDIGNSVSRLASGIDVRCRHGYVVAAPSHVKYDNGVEGDYHWLQDHDPSPLPEELRQTILREMQTIQVSEVTGSAEDGHNLWVRVLSSGFTSGRHNQELKDCARYLFRQGLSEDAITNTLSAINAKDSTPLPHHELVATIKSGLHYEQKRLEGKGETEKKSSGMDALPLVSVASNYDDYFEQWLIRDWLPENSLLMLAAPPENFKTWLLLDAAISVALGKDAAPFLGQYDVVNDPQPVYIVQQEDYLGQLMTRIRAIQKAKGNNVKYDVAEFKNDNGGRVLSFGNSWFAPIYVHTQNALAFDDDASMDALEDKIARLGLRLVVIDPLYRLGNSEDFFASLARKMGRIKNLRDTYNTAFILAHHTKKGNGDGEREEIFGSQLLNGAVEGVWLINKKDGQRIIKRKGKSFPGEQQALAIDFDINTDHVYTPRSTSVWFGENGQALDGQKYQDIDTAIAGELADANVNDVLPYVVTVSPVSGALAKTEDEDGEVAAEAIPKGKYNLEVLKYVMVNDGSKITEVAEGLGIHYTQARRCLEALAMNGNLMKVNGHYTLPVELPEAL